MEMKGKSIKIAIFIFIVFELLSILYVSLQNYKAAPLKNDNLYRLNDGWTYITPAKKEASISLPAILDTEGNHTVSIYRKFTKLDKNLSSIGILTTNQRITAYIDGSPIYYRGIQENSKHLCRVPDSSVIHIIPLPQNMNGKTLTLVIKSKYPEYAGRIGEIYLGPQSSILLHFIEAYGTGFVLSIIIFILGVTMLLFHYIIKGILHTNNSLCYLGWFTLISSIWFLSESVIPQFYINNTYVLSAVSYLSFMAMPVPILLYLGEMKSYYYKKTIPSLVLFSLGNSLVLIILQFFNIRDFYETNDYNRLVAFFILGFSLFHMWLDFLLHKNKHIKIFLYSATLLYVFGLIEYLILQWYSKYFATGVLRYGFLLFLLIMAWDALRKIVTVIKLGEKANQYKLLATRDSLTNCRNRAAYEKDITKIDLSKNITLFMADMNNMKEINDNYGHQAGDEVVILCSQCLMKVFGHRVYRIGGDEFICIEYDLTPGTINQMLASFSEECTKANNDSPYKFQVSIGYATYDRALDKDILDTVKRADIMMYEVKERMKRL
jgi:diguanylate cyclase (GGDEF)-like protein